MAANTITGNVFCSSYIMSEVVFVESGSVVPVYALFQHRQPAIKVRGAELR